MLCQHDPTTFLYVAISDKFFHFCRGHIDGCVVFVFDQDRRFVGSMYHDVSGFFAGADEFNACAWEQVDKEVIRDVLGQASFSRSDFKSSEDGGDAGKELLLIVCVGRNCIGELIDFLILLIEFLVETLLIGGNDVGDGLVGLCKRRLYRGVESRELFFQVCFDGFAEKARGFVKDGGGVFSEERSDVFLSGGQKDLFELFGLFFGLTRHGVSYFSGCLVEFVAHGLEFVKDNRLEMVGGCLVCLCEQRFQELNQREVDVDDVKCWVGCIECENFGVGDGKRVHDCFV